MNVVLAIDEDESFYDELARRIEADTVAEGPRPAGLVIIQVDGLAAPILRNAIRVGTVPRMASWVRSGAYHLAEWECPPPSQTSASQAGILHGSNDGIPAFRWYEKASGRLLVSNHPADATEIERRVSNGQGLLAQGGSSVGNLFTGDAQRSAFVMSRMGDPLSQLDVDAFSLYFMDPAAFIRTLVLGIGEFLKELLESRRQRIQDIQPRVHRGTTFAFLRAATNVVLRDLNTTFVVRSMSLGAPVIYTDLVDYDEIAHHAGPERIESLRALTGVDRVIASLERAAEHAPRAYRFVLLSDHGQSQGATFAQRYGQSLEELIRELMGGRPDVVAATGRAEMYGPVNALLTELSLRPGVAGRATNAALRSRSVDGAVELGAADPRAQVAEHPDVVVCASGNLANVYFTVEGERMRADQVEEHHPGLLAGLVGHPGIGFVMVRTAEAAVVLGARGVHHLDDDRVEGADPLAALRATRSRPPAPPGRVLERRRPAHQQRLRPNAAGGRRLRGAGRQPRWHGWPADPAIPAPPRRADPRGRAARGGAGRPPAAAALGTAARRDGTHRPRRATSRRRPGRAQGPALGDRLAGWASAASSSSWPPIVVLAALGGAQEAADIPLGVAPLLVPLVLGGIGLVTVLAGIGIWRRQRWAWMATLVVGAFNVLQVLLGLAREGLSGIVAYRCRWRPSSRWCSSGT